MIHSTALMVGQQELNVALKKPALSVIRSAPLVNLTLPRVIQKCTCVKFACMF